MNMITSRDNPNIKEIIKLQKSAKQRRDAGLFTVEGVRLCRDAALSGAKINKLVYTKQAMEKYSDDFKLISDSGCEKIEVSGDIFLKISDTKSPQGLLCVISMLDKSILVDKIENTGRYVALENISDPSNLGTILRTAEALGLDGIILSEDCCDVYSPKVARGSMGAVFRMKFCIAENFTEFISELTKKGIKTYAATPRDAVSVTELDLKSGMVLIGNEGAGLTDETISACSQRIKIPMGGRAESLNASAAAAILMWELIRSK